MSEENLLTEEELERAGLEALRRELGLVGMIRFLQLFDRGSGDYSVERHEWLDHVDLDTILARVHERRKRVAEGRRDPGSKEPPHRDGE
jgi:hypothetical protein